MRFTPISPRLCDLSRELRELPKPPREPRRSCHEKVQIAAAALYLLDSADDTTPAGIRPMLARVRSDVDGWARTLGEGDRAIRIVREMLALLSGEPPPPPTGPSRQPAPDAGPATGAN